jgi:hypothetical protein
MSVLTSTRRGRIVRPHHNAFPTEEDSTMNKKTPGLLSPAFGALVLAAALASACSSVSLAQTPSQTLTGAQEVPPVTTAATGKGDIAIAADGSVTGQVTTTNLDGTMAHIHIAPAGVNGPVIIPLTKTAEGTWSVPPGAKLTPEQLTAFKAGGLYVNVHSAANKGGEIRAQLKP